MIKNHALLTLDIQMKKFRVEFKRALISSIAKLLNILKYTLGKKLIQTILNSLILKVGSTFSDGTGVNFIYKM